MIKSMTGFGAGELALGAYLHRVEVRSVNSKFCDVKAKLPYDLAGLELRIHQHIRKRLSRGRIEVFVGRNGADLETARGVKVNWDLAESYHKAFMSIKHKFGISQTISLMMLANARDVVTVQRMEEDIEAIWKKFETVLDGTLDSLIQMREREGKSLAVDMAGRCNVIREFITRIGKLAPDTVELYKKRLEEKISAINPMELDQSRLAQEVCYFSDRCDISEEITRLKSHIQQFLHFLDSSDPVGRKLDFLVQEMNRETNTIGSKSNSAEISQIVVEIKSELEKLREQIQNVE